MRRRNFLLVLPNAIGVSCTAGCGTFLHPERVHSMHSRDIDWKVVALNGLGLAFFFVPGVIAFAVDFYTGAIYLPPEYASGYSKKATPKEASGTATADAAGDTQPRSANLAPETNSNSPAASIEQTTGLQKVEVPREQLVPAEIARVVSAQLQQTVPLDSTAFRVSEMAELTDFSRHYRLHDADPEFGMPGEKFFAQASAG